MHYNDLRQKMAENNIPNYEENIYLDGKIHRYSHRKNKDKSEWYIGFDFPDGDYYCTFGSWLPHVTPVSYCSKQENISDEHVEYIRVQSEKIKKEWEEQYRKTRHEAECLYEKSDYASPNHSYLLKKKIKPHGVRSLNEALLIPVYNFEKNIQSLQYIYPNSSKRFQTGSKLLGGHFVIGNIERSKNVYISEGFATAASIHEATGEASICAFSCHNLIEVGSIFNTAYPEKRIVLAADLGHAGEKAGKNWKERINDKVFFPNFKGKAREGDNDFNDLACHPELGKDLIKHQLDVRIKTMSFMDLFHCDYKLNWSVENLLIKGSVNMIYGEAGAGKSAFCFELAYSISQGQKFFSYNPQKQKVLYIDGELSMPEIKNRLHTILKSKEDGFEEEKDNLQFITCANIYDQYDSNINLQSIKWRNRLDEIIEDFDVIFFDNLSTLTLFAGEDNENSTTAWSKILTWCRNWKMKGKTIVIVHHSNKMGGARGSSILSVETMTEIFLEKVSGSTFIDGSDVHTKINFKKGREISWEGKKPFEIYLKYGRWYSREVPK